MKKLAGKVAVVTASTEGIGFAIARRLAVDGAKVVISSRKQENVKRCVQQFQEENLEVTGIPCHVGKSTDRENLIKKAIDAYGKLDILVSNAAVNPVFGHVLNTSDEVWTKLFDVNVISAASLTGLAAPHIEAAGGGTIIYISSIAGFSSFEGLGPYSVTKTALIGLTKVMARELGPAIRVNCIAPGLIKTRFSQALWSIPEEKEKFEQQLPLKRIGTTADVSGLASFLCSDESSYITGETIVAAGGALSRL
ncbi:dehydrogenase/reductase SDR family member 4-like [Oscarella lobularis]|uniref:dehydrogenase/reductase SDR family member 4-like n=1 Tax=Oscarella lobularis TaxID=121494 RepID=UPI0033132DAC